MGLPVLLCSNDPEFCGRFQEILASEIEPRRDVVVAENSETALAKLRTLTDPAIFLDVRSDAMTDQHRAFLDHLVSDGEPVSLAVISDGWIPRELTQSIDALASGYLDGRFRRDELLALFSTGNNGSARMPRRQSPVRKVIRGEDLEFATYSSEMFPVVDQLMRVARHDVTLLLVGETGTGKTTMARLIHRLSPRAGEPFQNVSCGALPPDLIESEFFGHVRGAFTGADRSKIGRFEAAGRGTLLLDEIDVLAPKEQTKLLRVIETGEFEPVGSTETRHSQARLVVASNVDLETLMQKEKFRSDLYYRLNVLEFRLLPLRERPLDIVPLAVEFIDECCREYGINVTRIHRDLIERVKRYPWPGNVRELKNHVQRAVLVCEDGFLGPEQLAPVIDAGPDTGMPGNGGAAAPATLADRVAMSERRILREALARHDYNRTATAKSLGITRVGLYKKMRKLGLLSSQKS